MKISPSRQAGFTLLEIMLVVAIIALLLGGAMVAFAPNMGFAKDTKVQADFQTLSTDLMMYNARNGTFPTTDQGLMALVQKPSSDPVPVSWVQARSTVPLDPWKRPYHYQCPGTKNPDTFDLWSSGPDGVTGTADDVFYKPQ